MRNGQMSYWVCYHKKLGFLRFHSYNVASSGTSPDPRGLYARKEDAERRTQKVFYHKKGKKNIYPGSEIQVVEVTLDWQAAIS